MDLDLVGKELEEFRQLLDNNKNLSERGQILPFFQSHRQLSAFVGAYHPDIASAERLLAFEYQLYGDFAADLVIGDRSRSSFCFIEFEDAMPDSVFRSTGRSHPSWSPRFLAAFGQIIDWFWRLSEYEPTPDFTDTYGVVPDFEGIVIIGRSADLAERERRRLRWFTKNCVINSKHIRCLTLDDMYDYLKRQYEVYGDPKAL